MNDPGILDRVYKTSFILAILGMLICWARFGIGSACGWCVGTAFCIGVLAAIQWFVSKTFVPGNEKAKSAFAFFLFLKMPVMLAVLTAIILFGRNIDGFIWTFTVGISLVPIVIILKAVGIILIDKMDRGTK